MTKQELIELFKSYKSNLYILRRNKLNKNELIEEVCLQAPTLSDIPKSITNKFNSTTENAAIRLEYELKAHGEAIRNIALSIADVNYLLDSLSVKQRLIIESFYILGLTWHEIAGVYQDMYKINYVSKRHLQRIEDEAVRRMLNNINKYNKLCK